MKWMPWKCRDSTHSGSYASRDWWASHRLFSVFFIVFDITAILGGYAVVWLFTYINIGDFLYQIAEAVSAADIVVGIIKAILFGITITVICLYHGFKTKRHITQVPVAASKASVQCFGSCLIISAAISALFYL